MPKSADAFRTISEVADDLDIPKHVLRFWEVKFAQIRPMKRGGGRRYYRPEDLELLKGIRHLLHREGYTIKGVQKILREQGIEVVKLQGRPDADRPVAPADRAAIAGKIPTAAGTVRADGPASADNSRYPAPPASPRRDGAVANSTSPAVASRPVDAKRRDAIKLMLKELESCRALLRSGSVASEAPPTASAATEPRRAGTRG